MCRGVQGRIPRVFLCIDQEKGIGTAAKQDLHHVRVGVVTRCQRKAGSSRVILCKESVSGIGIVVSVVKQEFGYLGVRIESRFVQRNATRIIAGADIRTPFEQESQHVAVVL